MSHHTDAWFAVEAALVSHFHEPDLDAARAFYSAIAAHGLPGQLVWPMMVAAPGGGKTETLNPMDGLPNVHLIDTITSNTFISGRLTEKGQARGKDSLLERIGNNAIMLFPDFSTILEGKKDHRDEIFAQLRRLYDGKYHKEVGAQLEFNEWEGRLTVGAAVTPAIDGYSNVFSALGDRFVMIRWPRVGGEDAALRAMRLDLVGAKSAMRAAVHGLFAFMQGAPIPGIAEGHERQLAALSEIIAVGRTPVEYDYRDRTTLLRDPSPESNTRLPQQLCQLAKGSARLEGRDMVTDADIAVALRVAFDTLNPTRRAALLAIASGRTMKQSGLSRTTAFRALRDLQDLDMVVNGHGENGDDVKVVLTDAYKRLWLTAKVEGWRDLMP